MTTILGLNAWHADAAACLVRDGALVAAVEEERFRRIKHWGGLPTEAVRSCLAEAGLTLDAIDHIAINRRPTANLLRKALFALRHRPGLHLVKTRLENGARVSDPVTPLAEALGVERQAVRARLHAVEHHRAHLASAFYVSPFERATVVSVDGFGDFTSAMWAKGRGTRLEGLGQVRFPHSLGLLYQALTQYLGFPAYGDEYKVMGLAAYGTPRYREPLSQLLALAPDGGYALALDYFRHPAEGIEMRSADGAPAFGPIFTGKLEALLGPARAPGEDLTERHMDIAASVQGLYEDALFHLLNRVQAETGDAALCLAGGCALNALANGKILARTKFTDLYLPPAAGDAGGAIGAAYHVWHETLKRPRGYVMAHAYQGPAFSEATLGEIIADARSALEAAGCAVAHVPDEAALCAGTAAEIARGGVVGWFQGRMEWGPRALGNRSILGDPRRAGMREILNEKIKHRESFRPFAPSILRERVAEWFEIDRDLPFMLEVAPVRPEKRCRIPAVTHRDGSGRLQTVARSENPRFHRLISAFEGFSGVPALLNTSFNENEPIVCRPAEAIACFLRTQMDRLVLGNWVIAR